MKWIGDVRRKILFLKCKTPNKKVYPVQCKMVSTNSWRGVPLTEINGSQTPWGAPEFPLVSPAYDHAVLYHISSNGIPNNRPPLPQIGKDKWDQDHVRLPCSNQSLYPVENSIGEKQLKKRWEIIEESLSKPIRNSQELTTAILSYNTKFKNIWKFKALHKLFDEYLEEEESQYFFEKTLPAIVKLALDLPNLIKSPIPLLKQHKNCSISLSQQQIASLLANAFFCTYPRRNTSKRSSEYASYPFINFTMLYNTSGSENVLEKLKCICHYFRRICTKEPVGVVTFSRRSVPIESCPDWAKSIHLIGRVPLHIDSTTYIEDAHGLIQVDFANKFLGGGVLRSGCVQEEIRFVISPELLVSMLFTEVLQPTEAVMVIGSEQYSKYVGYGDTFRWSGDCDDFTPWDSSHRRRCAVLAIDAAPIRYRTHQYSIEMVTRELNKAWVGFSFYTDDSTGLQRPGIATGNWGCGAFGGCPLLKSLIQMSAAAQAGRPMAYFTFGDADLRNDIVDMHDLLTRKNVTVGRLYEYLKRFSAGIGARKDVGNKELYTFIRQILKKKECDGIHCGYMTQDMATPQSSNKQKFPNAKPADLCTQNECMDDSVDIFLKDDVGGTINGGSMYFEDGVDPENTMKNDSATLENTNKCNTLKSTDSKNKTPLLKSNMATRNNEMATEEFKMASVRNKMIQSNKMAVDESFSKHDSSMKNTDHTSLLFEEMSKLDQENGKLNLNVLHSTSLEHNMSLSHVEDLVQEVPSEIKRRVTKKITDYFSKKTL